MSTKKAAGAAGLSRKELTPAEIKLICNEILGLTLAEFASVLGYKGNHASRTQMAWDICHGRKPLREPQRRLLIAYVEGYRPSDQRDWPQEPLETVGKD